LRTDLEGSKLKLLDALQQVATSEEGCEAARSSCFDEQQYALQSRAQLEFSAEQAHRQLEADLEARWNASCREHEHELALAREEGRQEARLADQGRNDALDEAARAKVELHLAREELAAHDREAMQRSQEAWQAAEVAAAVSAGGRRALEVGAATEAGRLRERLGSFRAEYEAARSRAEGFWGELSPMRGERDMASQEMRMAHAELWSERSHRSQAEQALDATRKKLDTASGDLAETLKRHLESEARSHLQAQRLRAEVVEARAQRDSALDSREEAMDARDSTLREAGVALRGRTLEVFEARRSATCLRAALEDRRLLLSAEREEVARLEAAFGACSRAGAARSAVLYMEALKLERAHRGTPWGPG